MWDYLSAIDFSRSKTVFISIFAVSLLANAGISTAADRIFDELRFGASASIQGGTSHEDGVFPEFMVLFDPFGFEDATDWKQQLMHPRLHLGTSIGTSGSATQVYGGFTWDVDLGERAFVEAGFGGTLHTGELQEDGTEGPKFGCALLFHEYVGAGFKLDGNWRVTAQLAHSSHANLCDGPNDGMSRAGIMIGYKF